MPKLDLAHKHHQPASPKRWLRLAPLVAALVLAGCSLAPVYEQPALPVATDWPIAPSGTGVIDPRERAQIAGSGVELPAAAGVGWRQFYQDPELQRLIELALEHNRDLRIAVLNIEAARAQYNVQRAEITPSIGAGATGQRQRTPGSLSFTGEPTIASQYQVGVSMPSFEIDFFGRIRNLSDAALAQYLATEENRRNVQITLVAQVAEAWLSLLASAQQSRLTEQTLLSRQQSYELVKARYEAGVGSALDLNQAETLLASARSNLQAQRRLEMQARNALTQLTGVANLELPSETALVQQQRPVLAAIPTGLPSSVLLTRPDVLAAEQQLRASNANIGAARAAFFPRVTLTGLFGTASPDLSGLFESGSHLWNFAPQISIPIFSGGALRGQLELAEVRRDIAVATYEKTIQQAFREVSDALAGTATYDQQLQAEADLVAAAQRSYELAKLRYESGVDSFLQLQDAERTLFSAQTSLVQSSLQELLNRVALYKALGGGWLADTAGPAPHTESAGGNTLQGDDRGAQHPDLAHQLARPDMPGAASSVSPASSAVSSAAGGSASQSEIPVNIPAASSAESAAVSPVTSPANPAVGVAPAAGSRSAATPAVSGINRSVAPVAAPEVAPVAVPVAAPGQGNRAAPATSGSAGTPGAAGLPAGMQVQSSTWRDLVRQQR